MKVQTTLPVIKFYRHENANAKMLYYVFSPTLNPKYPAGQNLQGYNYSRTVNELYGQFTITIKENTNLENSGFMDMIDNLDVIEIYEDGENEYCNFIGVITSYSYSASANGFQKILSISGFSIEYLFEFLTIALDSTAMAYIGTYVNKEEQNTIQKLTLNDSGYSIGEAFKQIYKSFSSVCRNASGLSNCDIIDLIDAWFGTDYIDDGGYKFQYPITNNLYTDSTVSLPPFFRNLLPSNVYEFYGDVVEGKPRIVMREKPFDISVTNNRWNGLGLINIDSETLIQYSLTRSINEVYTAFLSYCEGSPVTSDFYMKTQASTNGYETADKNLDKIKKFGYKPLICNFVGFNTSLANNSKVNNQLKKAFKELNERLKTWYSRLDEMYDASIKIVKTDKNDSLPKLGARAGFLGGQFYINTIVHSWNYGRSIEINYTCERGGTYDIKGNFSILKNATKKLAEIGVKNE